MIEALGAKLLWVAAGLLLLAGLIFALVRMAGAKAKANEALHASEAGREATDRAVEAHEETARKNRERWL